MRNAGVKEPPMVWARELRIVPKPFRCRYNECGYFGRCAREPFGPGNKVKTSGRIGRKGERTWIDPNGRRR